MDTWMAWANEEAVAQTYLQTFDISRFELLTKPFTPLLPKGLTRDVQTLQFCRPSILSVLQVKV